MKQFKTSITYSRSGHYTVSIQKLNVYGRYETCKKRGKLGSLQEARWIAEQFIAELS